MIKKKIVINNEKDLKKFYKFIKIYRYLKFLEFDSDNKEIKPIINALNIKRRNKRITYIYDYACSFIDAYWDNINYCGFKNNKCYTQQYKGCKYQNGCCRLCMYQSSKGCTTSNLTCKFYYCTEVCKHYKVLKYDDIKILKLFSLRQKVIIKHSYFCSREQILFDLKYSGIILYALKMFWRQIIRIREMSFKRRKKDE